MSMSYDTWAIPTCDDRARSLVLRMLAGAAACFPFAPVDFSRIAPVWLPLLVATIIGSYTSFWAYSEGLKRVEATKAVILATVEPLLATLIAWWWWDEFFAPAGWIGTALVMAAVFLIIIDGSRVPTRTGKAER